MWGVVKVSSQQSTGPKDSLFPLFLLRCTPHPIWLRRLGYSPLTSSPHSLCMFFFALLQLTSPVSIPFLNASHLVKSRKTVNTMGEIYEASPIHCSVKYKLRKETREFGRLIVREKSWLPGLFFCCIIVVGLLISDYPCGFLFFLPAFCHLLITSLQDLYLTPCNAKEHVNFLSRYLRTQKDCIYTENSSCCYLSIIHIVEEGFHSWCHQAWTNRRVLWLFSQEASKTLWESHVPWMAWSFWGQDGPEPWGSAVADLSSCDWKERWMCGGGCMAARAGWTLAVESTGGYQAGKTVGWEPGRAARYRRDGNCYEHRNSSGFCGRLSPWVSEELFMILAVFKYVKAVAKSILRKLNFHL